MSTIAASARMTELAAIIGEQHVVESRSALGALAVDGVVAAISVSPGNADEIAAVLRYAYERDLVVVPTGGMVHQEIGYAPSQVDILLRTERLVEIEHYDPGDLTIGVGAGFTIHDLQALLRDQGQMFPVDLAHSDRVTVGGAMAVAAHGPMKHFFGGLREFCIGVRFVTADGVRGKGGGRVVKNVAGFDLMKLMIGSYGTLGVITSASFKLFPMPRQTRTFVGEFATSAEAIRFRDAVVNSPLAPLCVELLSPGAGSGSWSIAVRAGGSDRVLARYASELGSAVTRALDGAEEQKFWSDVDMLGENSPVKVKLSMPAESVGAALESVDRLARENGLSYSVWGRAATGSLFLALENGMAEAYVGVVKKLRES
ncbi:MAG TPA: FAD-binding oxidoreductase, partial [Terriglobales bacterium]|nr:FAD-binding oxidoreductase [Terriglobales bacterium]